MTKPNHDWKAALDEAIREAGGVIPLAEKAGLSIVAIRRLKSRGAWGQKNMSPSSAQKIAAALDDTSWLSRLCPHVYAPSQSETAA